VATSTVKVWRSAMVQRCSGVIACERVELITFIEMRAVTMAFVAEWPWRLCQHSSLRDRRAQPGKCWRAAASDI
jgi:hypothetical protein